MSLIKSLAMIVIAAAIVFHALVPRYEVTVIGDHAGSVGGVAMRTDQWTGNVELVALRPGAGGADWLTITR